MVKRSVAGKNGKGGKAEKRKGEKTKTKGNGETAGEKGKSDIGELVVPLVPLGGKAPQVPLSIIAIIAEHLIGQHAFGTTANLNVASKAIHTETLAILYETLVFDDIKELRFNRSYGHDMPEGVKFTKYLFYAADRMKPFERLQHMPNIVMTVSMEIFDNFKESGAGIHIYRSVSSSTVYQILATPFLQRSEGALRLHHTMCRMSQEVMGMSWAAISGIGDPFAPKVIKEEECDEFMSKPKVRPVDDVQRITLVSGACIHDRYPFRLADSKTSLRLYFATILLDPSDTDDQTGVLSTTIEMMKASAFQSRPKHLFQVETHTLPQSGCGIAQFGSSTCKFRRLYADWHVTLRLEVPDAEMFVAKLKAAAEVQPKILLNRLHLRLEDSVADDLYAIFEDLRKLYASKITGMHHVLPSRSEPHEIVRCVAIVRMEPEVPIGDAIVQLVVTKLIGSLKVVSRKRGVVVEAVLEKKQNFAKGAAFLEEL